MISSRKFQLVIAVILACTRIAVLGIEPNEPGAALKLGTGEESNQSKTNLKFESDDSQQQWVNHIDREGVKQIETREEMVRGSFRPKYVAVLYVRGRHNDMSHYIIWKEGFPDYTHSTWIKEILSTSAGKSLSQDQVDLIHTGACIRILGKFGDAVGNHQHVRIYAVSEKDARKTVEAFIETLAGLSGTTGYLEHRREELQKEISKTEKTIPEKETELKSTQTKLGKLKENVYYLSADEAKQNVLELNKTLDTLEVEIAGLEAKISTIEKYKSDKTTDKDTITRLEAMLSEQAVELAGALARKNVAIRIRDQAHEFFNLNSLEVGLINEVNDLKANLLNIDRELKGVENQLAHPTEDMLPPQVFQNKVTIYPVRMEE